MDPNNFQYNVNRKIQTTNPPRSVKVVSRNSDGTYNLIGPDGEQLNSVVNQVLGQKWAENMWVTIEKAGGDWAISGLAALGAGD